MVDYKTTQMDIKLAEIFDGEYVRNSDSIHWDGEIVYDNLEQERYKELLYTLLVSIIFQAIQLVDYLFLYFWMKLAEY